MPNYLNDLSFNNLKLKLGPEFKLQYSDIVQAYLDTKLDLNINGTVGKDLNARGLIYLKKGRANLYTTPFKLDKNKDNYILFASRSGVVPFINFSLVSKVPDSIIPIRENNQDSNISADLDADETSTSERFQLSLYPALIENNDTLNNIFSKENLDIENDEQTSSNKQFSSQAWIAELGLDITDAINFAFQTVPGRDDLSPLGILTFQANPNLELLGSYDSNGDWKSQVQLFFRY